VICSKLDYLFNDVVTAGLVEKRCATFQSAGHAENTKLLAGQFEVLLPSYVKYGYIICS